ASILILIDATLAPSLSRRSGARPNFDIHYTKVTEARQHVFGVSPKVWANVENINFPTPYLSEVSSS
ncbi:hypothetical protein, partial [Mesorhizobium huakuii]|uniref:hypothetical protein n=1 Tax=Mesorhizobium huakuii TaxID=28104 RepID=UPI0024E137A0